MENHFKVQREVKYELDLGLSMELRAADVTSGSGCGRVNVHFTMIWCHSVEAIECRWRDGTTFNLVAVKFLFT